MSHPDAPPSLAPKVPASPPVALVVHGHFYQPPRENPWTDHITREPSAAPFPNWNARISAECYRANAFARLHGNSEDIEALVNNYAYLSFNFGPTLARWIAREDATTMERARQGDEAQARRIGAGGAMAQVWGHPILPLCSPRDRTTQITWGQLDFERRFGRKSTGIWLPETAADPATLEALIDAGIHYTILAPEQIAQVRPPGGAWKPVNRDTLDTGRAYRFMHGDGSGRSINLAIFDGPLSRELAFGVVTRDSESFLSAVKASAERSTASGKRLVLAASDGELYGHHKKFADLMLAHALSKGATGAGVNVTNLEVLFREEPPTWEAELAKGPLGEGTAWSCAHGLGRWVRHCGCAMRSPDESGWSQAWRAPLRAALDDLRNRAAKLTQEVGATLFGDVWEVRDGFGAVLDDPPAVREKFLVARGRKALKARRGASASQALQLMELSRSTLLMYASCGWFFDDVAGIESALVIRQAAYVLDVWKRFDARPPVKQFLERLAEARSNLPQAGSGADVFRRLARHRTTSAEVAAAVAFSEIARADAGPGTAGAPSLPGFSARASAGKSSTKTGRGARRKINEAKPTVVKGRVAVEHERTGEVHDVKYEARRKGALVLTATVASPQAKIPSTRITLDSLADELRDPIAFALVERLLGSPRLQAADGRAAIELARSSQGAGSHVDPMFVDLLRALLLRLLVEAPADTAGAETLTVVLELLTCLPESARLDSERRVQEWVWTGFDRLADRGRAPSLALRALGDKVGLRIGPPATGHHST